MTASPMRVCAVFVGEARDGGFNASALAGVEAAAARPDVVMLPPVTAAYDPDAMTDALARAAQASGPGGLALFVGGQGDNVAPRVAADWPDRRFSVIQGSVTGPNLSSHHVRQDDSAWLAGALAGRLNPRGVVGHLSGHRVRPGLRGRAAFAAGLRHAAPLAQLMTGFCGGQDDAALARKWTAALIAAGADPIFTMLNAGRSGAIEACRAAGARQIGNAADWTATHGDVFVGSALARIDFAVLAAIEDAAPGGVIREYGAAEARDGAPYASLAIGKAVSREIRAAVEVDAAALRAGLVAPWPDYDGPEFAPEIAA